MGNHSEVNVVYLELLDFFPQVDPRILKAVALENRTNIDAAFCTIIDDVLPYIPEKPSLNENMPSQSGARAEDGQQQVVEDVNTTPSCKGELAPNHGSISVSAVSDCTTQKFLDEVSKISNTDEVMSLSKGLAHHLNIIPEKINGNTSVHEDLEGNHGADNLCRGVSYSSLMANEELVPLPLIGSSSALMLHEVEESNETLFSSDGEGLRDPAPEIDFRMAIYEDEQVTVITSVHEDSGEKYGSDKSCHGQSYPLVITIDKPAPPPTIGSSLAIMPHEVCALKENLVSSDGKGSEDVLNREPEIDSYVAINRGEHAEVIDDSESKLQQDVSVTDWFDANVPANGLGSLPSQTQKIELLESSIDEAKNNKKTLFSSMEAVMNIMREVEAREKAAEKAKEMASKGGQDILSRAEELKTMLRRAKEANDMHAGEVYGERSILATEAKELQLRLSNLKEEKDEALCTLAEMHCSLEARLLAADEEIRKAEEDKLEKENFAKILFGEQKAILKKIVQKSQLLQLEAEENSKLREFLVDRGRMVDTLHGEIGVICQDVKSLKSKFDKRVPLSESISSSDTTCILASSSSSSKKSISSLVFSDHDAPSEPASPTKSPTDLDDGDGWEFLA